MARAGPALGPYATDTWTALAVHVMDELAHHGAEIALLRDLYPRLAAGASKTVRRLRRAEVAVLALAAVQAAEIVVGCQGIEFGAELATEVAEKLISVGLGDDMVHDSGGGQVSGADALAVGEFRCVRGVPVDDHARALGGER